MQFTYRSNPLSNSSLSRTRAAADAIPHSADVRLLPFEAELVLLDEVLLGDPVIDEIPG